MLRSETHRGSAPRQVEKLVAAQHALRPLHQRDQKIVFAGAERYRDAVLANELARPGVERPAVETIALRSMPPVRRGDRFPAAAQHGLDARDEFAAAERLRQVIVRAHFQPDDAIDLVALRGQHDDGEVRLRPQRAAERQPVLARQHEIEQDQVDAAVGQDLAHALASAAVLTRKPSFDSARETRSRISR